MSLESRLAGLKIDLLDSNGPAISTNRAYPFAIFWYPPDEEYAAREKIVELGDDLRREGWNVHSIDLMGLLLAYLSDVDEGGLVEYLEGEEETLYRAHRGNLEPQIAMLANELGPHFDAADGFPARVLTEIKTCTAEDDPNRAVVFLSRIGGLYPFYRTSALLRFLDQGVRVPTIVMYPGIHTDQSALSFMGEMDADRDYRPRIY
ncbi:MAG: BREX protein BrxB domain-containing protein [Alkalispirochaeta sp.]